MDDALAQLIREWMVKAWHDLQTARITASAADGPLDTAIYHCQQAAEKAVKGWLLANNVSIERTDDIRRLVRQAMALWPQFSRFTYAAEMLMPYLSAFRYPGLTEQPMPTREEFDEALKMAQALYEFVLELLPDQARPQSS